MNALPALTDLAPIAQRLRNREEEITAGKRNMMDNISTLVSLATEQGRDLVLAKTKLGKHLRWSEWLKAQVPNLPEAQAAKYERIATEQLTDARQAVFAFLPAPDRDATPERMKPEVWETAWGFAAKLTKLTRDKPIAEWPDEQKEGLWDVLRPIVAELRPDLHL